MRKLVFALYFAIFSLLSFAFFAADSKPAIKATEAKVLPLWSHQTADAQSPQTEKPKTIKMKVTAYCICEKCCGEWAKFAKTATGDDARICDGVAADPKLLPYRTKLDIPGVGIREVDDTGGAMRKSARQNPPVYHIDVRFPTHEEALKWGVRWLNVTILETPKSKGDKR
ncbi:MAG TPA: hypothetical protein VJB92_01875 [Candidatus Paceibacterota bacterium]